MPSIVEAENFSYHPRICMFIVKSFIALCFKEVLVSASEQAEIIVPKYVGAV